MIELANVSRTFDVGGVPVRALDGVSLTLSAGTVVAVTGPSGAGKSSLLHILGALDAPSSGTVRINGTDLTGASERTQSDFRLRNIGFVFQSFNLLPTLAAWENVALPRLFAGESIRSARGEAEELLERVGLGDRVTHRPSQLSGGQIQRVAIARALIMRPPVVLADEPTGNLDSKTSQDVMRVLRDLVVNAVTSVLVVVTHDVALADAFADRLITVRDGVIEADTERHE